MTKTPVADRDAQPAVEPPPPPKVEMDVKSGNVDQQLNTGSVQNQHNYFYAAAQMKAALKTSLKEFAEALPALPPGLHAFRDPQHELLLKKLGEWRILLLTSYQENAGFAAAHSLANDPRFGQQLKKALLPDREQNGEHLDLDLGRLGDEAFLGEESQVLLIEINRKCPLLDSALNLEWVVVGRIRDRLASKDSYLILSVDEELVQDRASRTSQSFAYYAVSHLRYLLERHFGDRAEEMETRVREAISPNSSRDDLRELYQTVAARLSESTGAFEKYLAELGQTMNLASDVRRQRLQPVQPQDVFREGSEIHRTAAFVTVYFPGLGQRDFERFVALLLGKQTALVEHTRQVISDNGIVGTIREEKPELWSERWSREADDVFRDCHLRTVVSDDGVWVVDFSEPYLRRELRAHFERHYPWYVRRQCQSLQQSGLLFAFDLSTAAVEGLVRLFVERAIIDPDGFGNRWLLDLVRTVRFQLTSAAEPDAPEATLAWVIHKLAVETQLRAHFHGRLSLLIREMLDREMLRPAVRQFFESLIAERQHEALLDLVLELAPRLRFVQSFDPLYWMRRLLDEGTDAVRDRTIRRLVTLARDSGPRIYEYLADIRKWLPEPERPPSRFSASNRLALDFPFLYCADVAGGLGDRFGVWPSRHPLFYALSSDQSEARAQIATLVEWALDPRGSTLDGSGNPGEALRIADVADLIEYFAWVLEGSSSNGPPEGRAIFSLVVEEIDRRIGARERSWLQRGWQKRQSDLMREAATPGNPDRSVLVGRKTKLDQLRIRFAGLSRPQSAAH